MGQAESVIFSVGFPVIVRPSRVTLPPAGRMTPLTARSWVVFPAPFEPTMATICLRATSKLTSCGTASLP